jgi:hypothetical protein
MEVSVAHKLLNHSCGIRLNEFLYMEVQNKKLTAEAVGTLAVLHHFLQLSKEDQAIKEVMNVWSYWQKRIFF